MTLQAGEEMIDLMEVLATARKTGTVSQRTGKQEGLEFQPSPKDRGDCVGSRIPRGNSLNRVANASSRKGTRGVVDLRSSIPIPVYRRSAEQLSAALQRKQSEPSPSGIRVTEKPRGPRPPPSAEQTSFVNPESAKRAQISDTVPPSASSSSVSSWDFDGGGEEPQRPATVFTGEYRIRTIKIPGSQAPGHTLRIASSAENLIMGGAGREPPNYAVTQRTNPSMVRYLDKLLPGTPKGVNSPKGTPTVSKGTPDSKTSVGSGQESTPPARNFCRPQVSLDSIQRRDISGKEMSMSRKPINRPSLGRLFSPSSRSLHLDVEPLVPKIPDQYCSGQKTDTRQVSNRTTESETSAQITPEPDNTPSKPSLEITPMPGTVIKRSPIDPHPPRSSSLRALTDFPENSELEQGPTVTTRVSSKGATNLKRNVTFNDFVPLGSIKEQESGDRTRPPESRSTQLLGSFRNIFKSRGGAADKDRTEKENEVQEFVDENQAPSGEQGINEANLFRNDSAKNLETKPKYPRLSGGVSWNKSSRNPKTADESPATPTSSVPRLLAPPSRLPESSLPSFARPTKSTRTKATFGLKGQGSITPDTHPRRPHVRTASTGSPQRLNRGSRRTTGGLLMISGQKKTISSPIFVEKGVLGPGGPTGLVPKNVDEVRSCLETLCKKVGEATTPLERDRHIRLALSLQQQLGNYQSVERAALEVEALAKEKRLEKKIAEDSLDTSLAEAQAQLDED
ncbi:hypothetical protein BDW59DRAFT_180877 [Aspergillus cavernicola]|uniref:Uncharacterized protein n=1 Tax=Aspergillus cavernicola TaxID=176166 RepID=A0ABR4I631_9EURO